MLSILTNSLTISPATSMGLSHFIRHPLVQSAQFQFSYCFASGDELVGTVEGDRYHNQPHLIFNLRHLSATYRSRGHILTFDTGFGQFNLKTPGALLSGTNSRTGSFFSLSDRGGEAALYNANTDQLQVLPWQPSAWSVQNCAQVQTPRRSFGHAWSTPASSALVSC